MNTRLVYCWALLLAAPVFSQQSSWTDPRIAEGQPEWFQLTETESQVRAMLGQPQMVADFGNYRSWQYQLDEGLDHEDFSHALVFRKSDGKLISVARTYSEERNVDALFPAAQTKTYTMPPSVSARFSVRVRHLSGGRLLMAMGVAEPGQATGQVLLMKESEVRYFYDWLADQLKLKTKP